ncbi:hypothetical protein ABZ357_38355 [Streptomyces sp. NPDC005917]|uniref:hypothetical protein n=1 Tax=unclassified Streptomyces TaxID=2593676 RepID=UPI0034048BB1
MILALAAAAFSPVLQAGPASAATSSGPDGSWTVTKTGHSYQVTLHLAKQLPAVDALPELAIDGKSVGVAKQSPDGLTLKVVTSDPAAADPHKVELAWNGQPDTTPVTSTAGPKTPAPHKSTAPVTPDAITAAATSTGPYNVTRSDYDFGDKAVTLSGLSGRYAELRAAAWVPSAPGPRPLVLLLHGRHSACYNPDTKTTDNTNWPCLSGYQPIPSYRGYDQSAKVLASQGYVVVSISADGINAQDNPYSDDAGTLARGQLVLDHLNLLAKADKGDAPGMSRLLKGKINLNEVGLMGHSRGGEGVVKAALLNSALSHPYGIKAVLPLAPIDFGRETLPDVPMIVVLPYCDGDVSNLQGQHFFDDTRYSAPGDHVMRSSLLVMGADHNFFNTEWTPGVSVAPSSDDWSNQDDPTCGTNSATSIRLTHDQQYQTGVALISGFFQLVIGGHNEFKPLFDGTEGKSTSVGTATIYTETQTSNSDRLDIAPLTGPSSNVSFSGSAGGQYCASVGTRTPISGLPGCTNSTYTSRFPSWTPANYAGNVPATPLLHMAWTEPTGTTDPGAVKIGVPAGQRDVSRYDALTFRAATDDLSGDTDLTTTVVDGAGRSSSVQVSRLSDALDTLPGTNTTLLPKTWLRTVRWPVSQMKGVNLHDIRQVVLTTPSTSGGAFLSDVSFASSSVGHGGPSELPQVSVSGSTVAEGDGQGVAPVTLSLSARSTKPVTAYVQSLAGTGSQIPTQAQRVVIRTGQTSVTVDMPLLGNTTAEPATDTVYKAFVSAPVNAVVGQDFAHITVHDDDTAT